jgi:hypothetical protein
MRRTTSLVVLLLLLGAGIAAAQMSGTYTVKKDGTGNFTSVYAAAQALSSVKTSGNVVIEIYEGVYSEGYIYLYYVNDTRPQDTITFRPASGAKVTITSGGMAYAFYGYYTNNVKVRDMTILSTSSYGFYMGAYCDGWKIENNIIRATSYGVYLSTGCDYDSIIGNDIKVSSSYGLYLYNSSYAYGLYIVNNMITGWTSYGIYAYYGYNWKILYNTIVGTGSYGLMQYYQYGDTIKDNIFQAQSYAWYRYYGDALPAYSNYNCFWLPGGSSGSYTVVNQGTAYTLAQWQAYSGRDGNSIQQDPLTGGAMNPHLKTGSPCINAGNAISYVSVDIDGDSRTANTPDIGADEYTTVGSPMSGTYYIKPNTTAGDTFPSFYKANCALAVRGQSGSVTFEVFRGEYLEMVDLTGLTQTAYWVSYIAHLTSGVPDDVTLNAMSQYGVKLVAVKRIRFRNINVMGYTSYGFYLYPNTSVSPYKTTDTIVIQGCNIMGASGIYAYNYYGGSDDSIYDNTIRAGSSYGIYMYGSSSYPSYRNYIAQNMIVGWTSYGIYMYYAYYPKVIYNTIIGSGSYGMYQYYVYGDTLKNNILQANSYAIYRFYGDVLPAYSNYNDFWNGTAGSTVIYSSSYGAMTLATWQGYGRDGNSIQQNPLTGAPINPHLKTGSPCINAANAWTGISTDIDGDSRTANTPDIGADEYTTVGSPMSGVFTIKQAGGGDFLNFTQALGAIALRGFGGNVQFDVYNGTYTGVPGGGGAFNFEGIGNGANRLVVRGYPGEVVNLNCAGFSYGIRLYNNQRIHLENLRINSPSSYGVYATSMYTNSNTTDSCALIKNIINAPSGIMWYYGDDDTIAGNFINASSSYGMYIYGYSGSPYSQRNVIYNNIVQGFTSYGIYMAYQQSPVLVYNTFRGTGSYAFYNYYNYGTTMRNNIFMGATYAMYYYYGDAYPASANYNDYRLNAGGSTPIYHYSYGAMSVATWKSTSGKDTSSMDRDPLFKTGTDAHLQPTSPCIDSAGAYSGITTDIDGDTRGARPDIGADEYIMDIATRGIIAPVGSYAIGYVLTPQAAYKHVAGPAGSFYAMMQLTRGGTPVYTESVSVTMAPNESTDVSFPTFTLTPGGFNWASKAWHKMAGDVDPTNDTLSNTFIVGTMDVGVMRIIKPIGSYDSSVVLRPSCKVKNFGTLNPGAFKVYFRIDTALAKPPVRRDSCLIGTLNPGDSATATALADWPKPHLGGSYILTCSTRVVNDTTLSNDVLRGNFTVTTEQPGWYVKNPMPPGAKMIKDGGWLAFDAGSSDGTGRIYAARGQKLPDFYGYAPQGDSWGLRAPWPLGIEGKGPSKGSAGCADGNGVVYATKGNNKQGFWAYYANGDSWRQRKDVPLGVSNKKVKGGTDITWAYKGSAGSPYLLKGYKNEFYRYDTGGDSWQTLTPAPVGASQKWDKGSWLAYDDVNGKIYAFKAKYMELYRYSPDGDSWSGALAPMPLAGSMGNKKAKDGSCGAFLNGSIYALKGGGTREFWKYTTLTNAWVEKETIPTGTMKKVKGGADMVAAAMGIYATKGNKSNELWRYVPSSFAAIPPPMPEREGVAGSKTVIGQGTSIRPNPLAGDFAVLRYGLPRAGVAELCVYNVTGQRVMAQTLVTGRIGSVNLDLRHLSNGVYLVKFASEDFESSQKLVVQR